MKCSTQWGPKTIIVEENDKHYCNSSLLSITRCENRSMGSHNMAISGQEIVRQS